MALSSFFGLKETHKIRIAREQSSDSKKIVEMARIGCPKFLLNAVAKRYQNIWRNRRQMMGNLAPFGEINTNSRISVDHKCLDKRNTH